MLSFCADKETVSPQPGVGVGVDVGVDVGVGVGVGCGVGDGVGVNVGVGVDVGKGDGVGVGVGVGGQSVMTTLSTLQPACETLLSLPMRQRKMIVCPAARAGKATTTGTKPLLLPVQHRRPPMGLPDWLLTMEL